MWNNVSAQLSPNVEPSTGPPTRVFIVHTTSECPVRPSTTIFAWPPPRIKQSGSTEVDGKFDGSYSTDEYVELMHQVKLQHQLGDRPWGDHNRTSCTQRWQGHHVLKSEGLYRRVESIFIPYGLITFACFQTIESRPLSPSRPATTSLSHASTDVMAFTPFLRTGTSQLRSTTEPQWGRPMTVEDLPPLSSISASLPQDQATWTLPKEDSNALETKSSDFHPYASRTAPSGCPFIASLDTPSKNFVPAGSHPPTSHQHSFFGRRSPRFSELGGLEMRRSFTSAGDSSSKHIIPYIPVGQKVASESKPSLPVSRQGLPTAHRQHPAPAPASSMSFTDGRKKKKSERDAAPSRVAVPPPDGIPCCINCQRKER